MRVAVVHNIIAPYRIPLFNLLSNSPGIDLTVLFMAQTERDRQWQIDRLRADIHFRYDVLRGAHIPWRETTVHLNPGLLFRLVRLHPDVILVTSLSAATAVCLAYGLLMRVPVVVWWAGTALTEQQTGTVKRAWRSLLIPLVGAFLCYSDAAAAFLLGLGVPRGKLFVAGNVTFDALEYHRLVEQAHPQAAAWRESRGLSSSLVILSIGRLIALKNMEGVLQVFAAIRRRVRRASLAIVGEGHLLGSLETLAAKLGLADVLFEGAVQPGELPMYYGAADLFIHLSFRDRWSQVVSEAMAAGLPVIVSIADQASDLIADGRSGLVVDPAGIDGVASRAAALLTASPDARRAMGDAAFLQVAERDVSHTLRVLLACLAAAARAYRPAVKPPPKPLADHAPSDRP
jgi:glycosyltransferase involved in cell wall biosynthesis